VLIFGITYSLYNEDKPDITRFNQNIR